MSKSLDRLSKLIAMADGASTEAERAAFMEKAEAISALIGVELSVARAHHAAKEREELVADYRVKVNSFSSRPLHRQAMMDLFLAIAEAHDLRCTISRDNYFAYCYGYPSDIELSETLYGALSLQMVSQADAALKRGEQKYVIDTNARTIGVDGRIYRRNFYSGFISRVSGRLWEARKSAIKTMEETSTGTELVLKDKSAAINSFYTEQTKHLSLRGTYRGLDNSDNYVNDAVRDGSAAGARASLGVASNDVAASNRRALS